MGTTIYEGLLESHPDYARAWKRWDEAVAAHGLNPDAVAKDALSPKWPEDVRAAYESVGLVREALEKMSDELLQRRVLPGGPGGEFVPPCAGIQDRLAKATSLVWRIFKQGRADEEKDRLLLDEIQKEFPEINLSVELFHGEWDGSGCSSCGYASEPLWPRHRMIDVVRCCIGRIINALAYGESIVLPTHAVETATMRVMDGVLNEQNPRNASADFIGQLLLPVLRQNPFPFGRCRVCGEAFLTAEGHGPFCSERCVWKARGFFLGMRAPDGKIEEAAAVGCDSGEWLKSEEMLAKQGDPIAKRILRDPSTVRLAAEAGA